EGEQSLGAAEEATRLAGGRGGPGGLVAPYLFACGQIEQYDASAAAAAIGQHGSRRALADDDAFGTHGQRRLRPGSQAGLSLVQNLPAFTVDDPAFAAGGLHDEEPVVGVEMGLEAATARQQAEIAARRPQAEGQLAGADVEGEKIALLVEHVELPAGQTKAKKSAPRKLDSGRGANQSGPHLARRRRRKTPGNGA